MADKRVHELTTTTDPTDLRFPAELDPTGTQADRGIDYVDLLAAILASVPASSGITSSDGSILDMIQVTAAEYAALEAGNDLVPGTAYWIVD